MPPRPRHPTGTGSAARAARPRRERAAVPAMTRRPLEDQDPVVLELLRLAAEILLAHPGAVPPALYDLCDAWADDLAGALDSCRAGQLTGLRDLGSPAPAS